MKILIQIVALAALAALIAADIPYCGLCAACDVLTGYCDLNQLKDLICQNCALASDGNRTCTICEQCKTVGCNADDIRTAGCYICTLDGGGGGGGGGGGTKAPSSDNGNVIVACFSEVATVQTPRGPVEMKDILIGDSVLTVTGEYETVYAFGHRHTSKPAEFLQIHHTLGKKPLEVTADHLVFLQGKTTPVPAKALQVGHVLKSTSSHEDAVVTRITTVTRKGIYAPLTLKSGTLVVDGVAASAYVSLHRDEETDQSDAVNDHQLIHMALSPYRLLCNGISTMFCNTNSYNEDGMPYYVHYGLEFLNLVFSSSWITRSLGLSVIVMVAGTCRLLEITFGASFAPLMVFLAGSVPVFRKATKGKGKVLW